MSLPHFVCISVHFWLKALFGFPDQSLKIILKDKSKFDVIDSFIGCFAYTVSYTVTFSDTQRRGPSVFKYQWAYLSYFKKFKNFYPYGHPGDIYKIFNDIFFLQLILFAVLVCTYRYTELRWLRNRLPDICQTILKKK